MSANDGAPIAPTIREILGDEELALLFREFLHQLQCAENLSFYVEVEDYKRLDTHEERVERFTKLWNRYLDNESPTPLNIDSKVRQRIQSRRDAAEIDIFDEASEFAFSLLAFDCYRKFISSETYAKWLKDDAKKKPKWSFLFFKKKKETPMQKTESIIMLQKHVAINGTKK